MSEADEYEDIQRRLEREEPAGCNVWQDQLADAAGQPMYGEL